MPKRKSLGPKRWKVRSGRRILGRLQEAGKSVAWVSTATHGTQGLGFEATKEAAALKVLADCGMSPRQYEFTIDED